MGRKIKTLVLMFCLFFVLPFYQNCGDTRLSQIKSNLNKLSCLDAGKNLTIVDTANVDSNVLPGSAGQLDFAIYVRNPAGSLVAFVPEDPGSQWPPRWFKNNLSALPTELLPYQQTPGVIFRTTLNQTSCSQNYIKAQIRICGNDMELKRNFYVGSCPRDCFDSNSGITGKVGDIVDFYLRSQPACGQNCDKIRRECLTDGSFGPPIGGLPPGTQLPDYRYATCNPALCPTPIPTPSPIPSPIPSPTPIATPPPPVPSPIPSPYVLPSPSPGGGGIEDPGCVPAFSIRPIPWDNLHNRQGIHPWPSFGNRAQPWIDRGSSMTIKFETPSNVIISSQFRGFGTYTSADCANCGEVQGEEVPRMLISISETAGCVDYTKLDPRCIGLGGVAAGGVGWSMIPSQYSCPLQPGKSYYINLTYGDLTSFVPGQPYCPSARCAMDTQNQPQ